MAEERRRTEGSQHNIIMENRGKTGITGVMEVVNFDESQVVMETSVGTLTVSGENLHVEKLSLDIGEVTLAGTVDAIVYSNQARQKGSFWSRLF